jgi:hypothetical protein
VALPYLAGKSSNTKGTKYTKGKRGAILRAFSFVTFAVSHQLAAASGTNGVNFVFKKVFPLETVEPIISPRFYQYNDV